MGAQFFLWIMRSCFSFFLQRVLFDLKWLQVNLEDPKSVALTPIIQTHFIVSGSLAFSRFYKKLMAQWSTFQVKSSYKLSIMHSASCKEQQHSQKQDFFVIMV
jgi:hypothetical protein